MIRSPFPTLNNSSDSLPTLRFPDGISLAFGEGDRWLELERGAQVSHLFTSSGLSEPLALRLRLGEGEAEIFFDPLTAMPVIDR